MADVARIHGSRSPIVNGLLHGTGWKGEITFALAKDEPSDPGYAPQHVEAPPRALATAVRAVFSEIASFTAADYGRGHGEDATVTIYTAESLAFRTGHGVGRLPLGGYAFFPGEDGMAGDVWIGDDLARDLAPGGYGYRTLMHEIGHALGLKHPHERGGRGTLPENLDGAEYSVMSARSVPGDPVAKGLGIDPEGHSTTFMPYDVAALQHLYGADYSDRGNDRYRFDPMERVINETIWDGGGEDTYDFSLYPFAVKIDLMPGGVCTTGQEAHLNRADPAADPIYADGAIHNAMLFDGSWRSAIENAAGGWGDDLIRGNRVDNHLVGSFGDDTLVGDRLFDTLEGGWGNDGLAGGTGADRLFGGDGNDKLVGQQGSDALFGGAGADILAASTGNDTLHGGSEDDRLAGGFGNDLLTGGAGADVFVLDAGADVVTDFVAGLDRIDAFGSAAAVFATLRDGPQGATVGSGAMLLTLSGVDADALTLADFF